MSGSPAGNTMCKPHEMAESCFLLCCMLYACHALVHSLLLDGNNFPSRVRPGDSTMLFKLESSSICNTI